MVKDKVKGENLSKFLNAWDKNAYDLNVELKKIHQKHKKEQVILRKKKEVTFSLHR